MFDDARIFPKCGSGAVLDNFAAIEHVGIAGCRENASGVLFDQENRQAGPLQHV